MHSNKHRGLGVRVLVFFSLVNSLLVTSLSGQNQSDTTFHKHISEVVVTSTKSRFSIISPMPMQLLTGKDLENLNSLSVADAIRYFSGVQLKDYGGVGGLKTINVRGLGSAHTAVFYDGIHLGNAQNGQVDLGKFSLDNIEEIQLYNGQKSTIFQPARGFFSSNTLFLKTKTPQFRGAKTNTTKINFRTGSFGLINPSVLFQQKLSSKLSLSLSSEWIKADGEYKFRKKKEGAYDTTAIRQNGHIEALRAEMSLFAKMGENGSATLRGYFYSSDRGLPGAIVANKFSYYQSLRDRNIFVQGSLQKSFTSKHELLLNAKYSKDYNNYTDPEQVLVEGLENEGGVLLDNHYYQDELYISLVNQYSINSWWNVSLSGDFSYNTLDADLYRFPYPTRYSYWGALSSHIQWERLDMQASMLGAYVDERVKYFQKGDSQKVFCPVLSASYQPLNYKQFRVRAFYKESFRMPTFNDLYYTFMGNSSLRPEYTTQYNVGATWMLERTGFLKSISIQSDLYYNRVRDKIVAVPSANLFRWTMVNLGLVEIKGIEVNANLVYNLGKDISVNMGLNYTYQNAIDITKEGTAYGDQIPYTPWHSGTATTSAVYKVWRLNYSFIYTGERYNQKANIAANYVQPWYTSDIALVWQDKWKDKELRLCVEVNNLFNQYYSIVESFPLPGRSFRITASVSF